MLQLKEGIKKRNERFAHILAGCIILLHGFEKFDSNKSLFVLFAIAGLVFLTVAALHARIAKFFPYVDGVFFVIESVTYFFIAIEYFHLGKKGLPWCYVFASAIYLVVAILKAIKGKKKYRLISSSQEKPGEQN